MPLIITRRTPRVCEPARDFSILLFATFVPSCIRSRVIPKATADDPRRRPAIRDSVGGDYCRRISKPTTPETRRLRRNKRRSSDSCHEPYKRLPRLSFMGVTIGPVNVAGHSTKLYSSLAPSMLEFFS